MTDYDLSMAYIRKVVFESEQEDRRKEEGEKQRAAEEARDRDPMGDWIDAALNAERSSGPIPTSEFLKESDLRRTDPDAAKMYAHLRDSRLFPRADRIGEEALSLARAFDASIESAKLAVGQRVRDYSGSPSDDKTPPPPHWQPFKGRN